MYYQLSVLITSRLHVTVVLIFTDVGAMNCNHEGTFTLFWLIKHVTPTPGLNVHVRPPAR